MQNGKIDNRGEYLLIKDVAGRVRRFNQTYGFITSDVVDRVQRPGADIFVHFSKITPTGEGIFKTLRDGDNVMFDLYETARGLQAFNVRVHEIPVQPMTTRRVIISQKAVSQ